MLIVEGCLLNVNGLLELDPHKYLDVKYWAFQPLMIGEMMVLWALKHPVGRKQRRTLPKILNFS